MKAQNFKVSFDGNVINTGEFTAAGVGTIVATGGALSITTQASAANYNSVSSVPTFDLSGSAIHIQCTNAGNQALASLEVYPIELALDGSNSVFWLITANSIQAWKKIATVGSIIGSSTAYDANVHRFFRIREDGGTVYWEYSTDAVGWVVFQTELVANLFAVTNLYCVITVGVYAAELSATTGIFDNLNITKTPTNTLFFKRVRPAIFTPGRAR